MKRLKWKKWLAAVLSVSMLAASCLGVSAAGLKDYFDAGYYSSKYEDLQKAFDSDTRQLLNHYLTYGLQEGRNAVPFLNLARYRAAYPDLEKAFGDDWSAYVNHYLTYGIKEGRSSFADFDAAAYAERYPDLRKAFGYDAAALYQHWVSFGEAEGRDAGRPEADFAQEETSGGEDNSTGQKPGTGEEPGTGDDPGTGEEPGGGTHPGPDVTGGDVTGGDVTGGDVTGGDIVKPDNTVKIVTGGQIKGYLSEDKSVAIYKGIPYAAPPVGELRWKAPQPVEEWEGVKDCSAFSANAMQSPQAADDTFTEEFIIDTSLGYSEDCLYLNVWSKAGDEAHKKPVIVYLHGGGFISGGASCDVYDGEGLARKDVVYVSLNYRLGLFGFLTLPELSAESGTSGNYGLMDQIAALQWVQENIEAFGGDPDNVMVVGQSAGAACAELLAVSPEAEGLMKNVAVLSYSQTECSYMERQDCETENQAKFADYSLEQLRDMSGEELLSSFSGLYMPCIDGKVLIGNTRDCYIGGTANPVNVLTGSVPADSSLTEIGKNFLLQIILGPWGQLNSVSGYKTILKGISGFDQELVDLCLKAYPVNTDDEVMSQAMQVTQDSLMASQVNLTKARALHQDGSTYIFDFQYVMPGPKAETIGAFHTSDVPYWLDYLSDSRTDYWTERDAAVAETMSSYLVNFARRGNPNGEGLPAWSAADGTYSRLLAGEDGRMQMQPYEAIEKDSDKKAFWDAYTKKLGIGADPVDSDNPDNPGEDDPEKEHPLMTLNEDGYFAETFCRTLDMDAAAEWSGAAMLFYPSISEEGKAVLNRVKTVGDVYEYGSVTFYPNGTMKLSYKFQDDVYAAFSERELFVAIFQQAAKEISQAYTVDKKNGKVTLMDGTVLTLDTAAAAVSTALLLQAENYSVPGIVEGSGGEVEVKYNLLKDVSYGQDARNTMDVFVPKNLDTSRENGAFILIYGGSWTSGNKEDNWALAQQYAENGYVAVAINMRNCYYDEELQKTTTNVYDMLNDVQGSVKKLKELSLEKGWNITQCATKGFSSGANIAMLYAYSRGMDVPYFDTEVILPVRFAANVVGPVDMHDSAWYADEEWPTEDKQLVASAPGTGPAFASLLTGAANKGDLTAEELEEAINSMSPVWYVENGGGVPTVIGYSKKDIMQSPNNGKRLKGYLDAENVHNDLYTFPNSIHSYAADPELAREYFEKTIEYAETYFITE